MTRNTWLVALLVGLVAATACAATPDGGTDTATRQIDWAPCAADATAECGTLTVPVHWQDPGGETVDLALTRRPATNPVERIGSLVVNFGGPGSPGALMVLHAYDVIGQLFSPDLLAHFDLVGFDPRGVGNSQAIRCSPELLAQMPDPMLDSQADFDARVAYNARLRADCRAGNGALYDHVDTLSVVHDVDAIRAALGEQQLTYYGTSFGTHIGQQYAEEYPERVRALALDSNVDHSLDTTQWVQVKAEMFQDAFDAFVSWCAGDARCAFTETDVRVVWRDLLARADGGEFPDPRDPGRRLDSFDLIRTAFNCFYGPEWGALAEFLHTLDAGGSTPDLPCAGEGGTPPVDVVDPLALSIASFCSDYALPVADYQQWKSLVTKAAATYAPDVRVNPNAVERIAHCLGHDHVPNPQHELDVTGTAPLLLGNGRYDPVTGYNLAINVAEQIGDHGVLLTYEGAGHGVYGFSGSNCVTRIFDNYLIHTKLPQPGARCPAVPYQPR